MLLPSIQRLRRVAPEQLFEHAVLVAVVLAGVVAMSPNVADPDLWGHVQYGRDLLAHGLPATTTYSYVAQEVSWINHENLMEALLALGADWLGPLGLVAAKMLAGLALLLVVLRTCRRQNVGLLPTCLILLLTASGVAHYWSLRPQLFSFAACAAMLALLGWCFEGWEGNWQFDAGSSISYHRGRMRWLWLVPLLVAAWTNAHGGFLAGGAIFITYLVLRGVEAYRQGGAAAIGLLKRFAMLITGTLAATFINPYGFHFHLWLLDDLRVPRPEITEWLPPSFTDPQSLPLLLLIATLAVVLLLSRRSFDATHLVILLATLWQALAHQRHIPFFALSVAFFLPRHVESVLARLNRPGKKVGLGSASTPVLGPPYILRILAAVGLLAAYLVLGCKLYERASDLKVHRGQYPVSAVQFMAERQLHGRVLCAFNWAQYVLSAGDLVKPRAIGEEISPRNPSPLAPGFTTLLLVHVDGRCRTAYSQSMLDEHFDFLLGDQPPSQRYRDPKSRFDPTKALDHGSPNLVLIDRGQPHSVEVMQNQSKHWVLLYRDGLAQLWGRRERYDDPQSPDYLPRLERRITDEPQQGHVTWPALQFRARSVSKCAEVHSLTRRAPPPY